MALARRRPAQSGSAGDAPAARPRPLAARGGRRHDGSRSVTRTTARAAVLALVLAGCATLDKPPATLEARKPPAGMTQVESESAPRPAAVDQTRVAEQLNRIAAELGELQNAVVKLIASSRLQDDQLAYLRRRAREADLGARRQGLPGEPRGPSGARAAAELGGDLDDVGGMDLHDRGLADERDGEHEPRHPIFAEQFATNPGERAADHLDVHALGQERMRIVLQRGVREPLDR